jgi:ubiquinone biosynthesis protein
LEKQTTRPLRILRNLRRSGEVVAVLIKYGYGDLVDRLGITPYLRLPARLWNKETPEHIAPLRRGERIRLALEELGPTFVKFGQILSTRPDLIPDDILRDLSRLQEQVTPFATSEAILAIEDCLGKKIDEVFSVFQQEPLGAGSLGQVYRAVLRPTDKHGPDEVVIKIRRPHVDKDVERDLLLMIDFSILIARNIPESEVFDPVGLVEHFKRVIRREINFTREARAMQEFHRLFRDDATLYVPKVYSDYTHDSMLVIEYIDGLKTNQLHTIPALDKRRDIIASNVARVFIKQTFDLGVFHADPHPGNVRILKNGTLCLLDYGIIGRLEERTRGLLIDLLCVIPERNVDKGVSVILKLGHPMHSVDRALLAVDFQDFVDAYFDVPLSQMNLGEILTDFVRILSSHGIVCPADLLLLIRALVGLEGAGRQLNPGFNLADVLLPSIKRLVRRRYHPKRMLRGAINDLSRLIMTAQELPHDIHRTLDKLNRNDLRIHLHHEHLDRLITELDRSGNRIVIGLIISSMVVASALIIRTSPADSWISSIVFIISALLGMWLIYGIFRSGRL